MDPLFVTLNIIHTYVHKENLSISESELYKEAIDTAAKYLQLIRSGWEQIDARTNEQVPEKTQHPTNLYPWESK